MSAVWGGVLREAVGLSMTADRKATSITLLSFSLRPSIPVVLAAIGAVILDAALVGDVTAAVVGCVALAGISGLAVAVVPPSMALSQRMVEATNAEAGDRLMRAIGGITGLEPLDEPELLDQVEVLQQEKTYLALGADALSLVLGTGIRMVLTVVLLAYVSPILLLTPIFVFPVLWASRSAHRLRAAAQDLGAGDARLARHLTRTALSPPAWEEMRVFGFVDALVGRQRVLLERSDTSVVRAVLKGSLRTGLAGLVFGGSYMFTLYVVSSDYLSSGATLGQMVLALTLVISLNLQLTSVARHLQLLRQATGACARLLAVEGRARADAERWNGKGVASPALERGIKVENLRFSYPGSDREVLKGINLDLPAGAVVAVVGENGCGKTTLVKVLAGLYQAAGGHVLVDGVPLSSFDAESWRSRVSACFQDFGRLEFVVHQSVGVGNLSTMASSGAVRRALADGSALDFVERLPQGMDTPLGSSFELGIGLSGGQWQRLALARARMRERPLLLLLDEPGSAIDPLAEQQLLAAYLSAARQASALSNGITIFTSHRLSTAKDADLVVVLDAGTVLETGHHDQLLRAGGLYRAMYETQARGYREGKRS